MNTCVKIRDIIDLKILTVFGQYFFSEIQYLLMKELFFIERVLCVFTVHLLFKIEFWSNDLGCFIRLKE